MRYQIKSFALLQNKKTNKLCLLVSGQNRIALIRPDFDGFSGFKILWLSEI